MNSSISYKKLPSLNQSRRLFFVLTIIGYVFYLPSAYAQLSVDSLGLDTSKNESYACVRFTDSALNTVSVTNESGEETFLSISNAKKRVKSSLRRAKKRVKNFSSRLKALKQEQKSIQIKIIPRPNTTKLLKRLKKQIKKTKKALALVKGHRKNLTVLQKQVAQCSKDAPVVAGVVVRSVTYPSFLFNGEHTSYAFGVFYNVSGNFEESDRFCFKSTKRGIFEAGVIFDPCPVRDADFKCIAQYSGVRGIALGGVLGTDFERACAAGDEPWRCDIEKASTRANEIAAEFSDITVLGKPNSSGCDRFR